jgi:hypothetical protein
MSTWKVDWYSSTIDFPGRAEYDDEAFLWRGPPTYDPLITYQPRTWLLREGLEDSWANLLPRSAIRSAP